MREQRLEELRRIAWLLDESIKVPGIDYRIGLDGIIGLIPGIGDALTLIPSGYIIYKAHRWGADGDLLFRMIANVLLEAVIGTVPLIGDLFDFVWKANMKNIALLETYLRAPVVTVR